MSYSKGPWRVRERLTGSENHQGYFIQSHDIGWNLAIVQPIDSDGVEGKANAKLMAASPAMYEALKVALNRMEVVHWVDSVGDHGPDSVVEQEIEMVKKAIQQAEGGE